MIAELPAGFDATHDLMGTFIAARQLPVRRAIADTQMTQRTA
jgi:hypothetical protein